MKTILLIEGDAAVREGLAAMLELAGCGVVCRRHTHTHAGGHIGQLLLARPACRGPLT